MVLPRQKKLRALKARPPRRVPPRPPTQRPQQPPQQPTQRVPWFHCTECTYSSVEKVHVKNHMRLRHAIEDGEPLDLCEPHIQEAMINLKIRMLVAQINHANRRGAGEAHQVVPE